MYLKSSMDRFIENGCSIIPKANENLKSSMDRFIVFECSSTIDNAIHLKSSMDRFIGCLAVEKFCFYGI